MFFLLSKIVGFLTLPSNLIAVVLFGGGVIFVLGWRRSGAQVVASGLVLLLLFGFSPLATMLLLALSERFPPSPMNGPAPDGIIILGGAIDPDNTLARGSIEIDSSGDRVIAMLQLARRYPEAKIVFSGGSANVVATPVPEAQFAGRLLTELGLAGDRLVLENDSRTTAENAEQSKAILQPKRGERWLLVTSAFHMPRSIGTFRAAGFDVEAYPVDWRTRGWEDAWVPFDKLSAGLARSDVAVHEWVGLLAYWLTGRTSTLFPKP